MKVISGLLPGLADAVKEIWERWIGEIERQLDIPRTDEPVPQPIYVRR